MTLIFTDISGTTRPNLRLSVKTQSSLSWNITLKTMTTTYVSRSALADTLPYVLAWF